MEGNVALDSTLDPEVESLLEDYWTENAGRFPGGKIPETEMLKLVHEVCASLDIDSQTALTVARKSGAVESEDEGGTEIPPPADLRKQQETKKAAQGGQADDVKDKPTQDGQGENEGMPQFASVADVVRAHPGKSNKEIEGICDKIGMHYGKSTVSAARNYINNHPQANGTGRAASTKAVAEKTPAKRGRPKKTTEAAAPVSAPPVAQQTSPLVAGGSALELLAAAEAQFREGMSLVEQAKAKFAADAERLKTLAPFEAGIQAAINAALNKK